MAYGRGKKGLELRAARVGLSDTTPALAAIRDAYLAAVPQLVAVAWPKSALDVPLKGKDLDALMLPVQRGLTGVTNSVWVERARIAAKAAVANAAKVVRRKLIGRVMHLDTYAAKPLRGPDGTQVRRLVNFPDAVSFVLSEADVVALKARTADLTGTQVVALLRKVRDGRSGLPAAQADALKAMVDHVDATYLRPEWKQDAVVQLNLDPRSVLGTTKAWPALLDAVDAGVKAAVRSGEKGEATLAVTAHRARGGHVTLPLTFRPRTLERLIRPMLGGDDKPDPGRVTALTVEVGPVRTEVKAVVTTRPSAALDLGQVITLVGRDFGYAYTCSWTVVRIPAGLLTQDRIDQAKAIIALGDCDEAKSLARAYLSTHGSTIGFVEQRQHEGRDFLDAVHAHCKVIDACQATVDETYANLRGVKKVICDGLGLAADAKVDLEREYHDPRIAGLVSRLGRQLASIAAHKVRRKRAYAAIDGLKRSWFGWVANREVELLHGHPGAVLVREALTNLAIEVLDPKYKGRAFNRMINAGARGRYAACAGAKLRWNDIRELQVPSYYTSTTDHRHSAVDAAQRKGETFKSAVDGERTQADLHASHTIALWLVMELRRIADGAETAEVALAA